MALEHIKCVITSGCSFSANDYVYGWPYLLRGLMPHAQVKILGLVSSGNEVIQKKATLALVEALQHYDPNEILVLPMWSGLDRKAFYISNKAEIDRMVNKWKQQDKWWHTQFTDLKNQLAEKKEMFVKNNGEEHKIVYNPLGGWYLFHTDSQDGTDINVAFSKTNLDFTYGIHIGLENIIFLQEFCKSHNVKIFHQFFMDSVLDSIEEERGHQLVWYLYDQLDKELIVSKSIHGWLDRHYSGSEVYLSEGNTHPGPLGHKLYTHEVLWPFLKERLSN